MADIGIRRATQNRMGLEDALRGIVAAGAHEAGGDAPQAGLDAGDEPRVDGLLLLAPLDRAH
jgi:hypothetical protein